MAAEQKKGGPRGNGNAEAELEAARHRALDQLANKDLPGLGSDEANIQGDLDPRVPTAEGLAGAVDKGALARNIEQAMVAGGSKPGVKAGGNVGQAAPGAPGSQGGSLRIDAAAAVAAAAAAAANGSPQAPSDTKASSAQAGGVGAGGAAGTQSAVPAAKVKTAEELSREAMDKDDFELARMAMDFGKKQMKKGQYLLAVENFRNAKRMGWHQATVDGLIADCQRLQKEMDGALEQGQALMRQKRWQEAIPYFKKAQKLGDDSNTTNNLIMECEDYLQQAEKAAREAAEKQ